MDYMVHVGDENCARFAQISDAVKADPAVVQMLAEIDRDLEATLFPELRELTEMPDASTKDMHDVCNYLYWATLSGLELKFQLTEEQLN